MEGVDNKYIREAIVNLLSNVGVKRHADTQKIVTLIRNKKTKEGIKEISKYLGLPIEVNILYVPKGYRPNATDGFHSTQLVKTDSHGQGSGITAQVSIPGNLPLYGSPQMVNFPITVRVSENCSEHPTTFVAVMAHELSHIVLYSMHNLKKENEFYTDLTAMLLGFSEVMKKGRKVVITKTESLIISTRTTTSTTTYGYLSDDNFSFAFGQITSALSIRIAAKKHLTKDITKLQSKLKKQQIEIEHFRKYLKYIDNNLRQNFSKQDEQWIYSFHQPDFTDDLELAIKKTNNQIERLSLYTNQDYYNNHYLSEIKGYELAIKETTTDLDSKYYKIRGAIIILKKYVPIAHRFSFFKI